MNSRPTLLYKMTTPKTSKRIARKAGFLYLFLAITSIYGLVYVPSKIIVLQNAHATIRNIITSPTVFRLGVVSNIVYLVVFVFLVLTFYELYKEVNKKHATLMVALVLVGIPVAFVNELNHVVVLILLRDNNLSKTLDTGRLEFFVQLFVSVYEYGSFMVMIFWGLWLLPLGLLVIESNVIPKVIGILLLIGCTGYVVSSFVFFLSPQYGRIVFPIATIPSAVSEVALILWLLIKGANDDGMFNKHN